MAELAASLLEMDYTCLGNGLALLREEGLACVHIDVMDGQFVPSLGIGTKMIESLRKVSDLFFDVHLMVKDPDRLIERMAQAGADQIIFHLEACDDPAAVLDMIRRTGKKAGISLRPETPLDTLDEDLLRRTDTVLLMTTVPGVEGVSFLPSSYERIGALKERLRADHLPCRIEVDGGINASNIAGVARQGAEVIVAGRALVLGDIRSNVRVLRSAIGGES